jgi:acetyl-CoA acetyltransferase family protein
MKDVFILAGRRTPFVKAGGPLANESQLELGKSVLQQLCTDFNLSGDSGAEDLLELYFGSVLLNPRTPNLARELILRSNLSPAVGAHFVSNNCITGILAVALAKARLETADKGWLALAGGVENMSYPALTIRQESEKFFIDITRARTIGDKWKLLKNFKPNYLLPETPSPKEPSTGLTMGEHCEISNKEFNISREEQDEWALGSHKKAAAASIAGFFDEELVAIGDTSKDLLIRGDTSINKLSSLKAVFDREGTGTLTAGNSSPLTDGASVVLLANSAKLEKSNLAPLARIVDIEFSAISPSVGLLMAPVLAIPRLLNRQELTLADIDLFEIHEAFAAQVLATLKVLEHGWEKFPENPLLGAIPREKINVHGGSLALGHPFAATGGRILLTAANGLRKLKKKRALISVCAAGGMGAVVLLENAAL